MSRQRKGKGIASSSSSYNDTELYGPEAYTRFNQYKTEAVTKVYSDSESKIDDGSIEITKCFKFQGLHKFLAMGKVFYPTLLRQMLANAQQPRDEDNQLIPDTLQTKVNNLEFLFDVDDIVKAFKLVTFQNSEVVRKTEDIPQDIIWREVQENLSMNPQMAKKGGLLASCMTLQCRIIHKIVAQCLLGKASGFDQVSLLEQYLVYVINGGVKRISWAHLIFEKIRYGPLRKSSVMPYGFALCNLMVLKGVDVSQAPKQELNKSVDIIGEKMMSQMGFEKNRQNKWVLKQSRRRQAGSSSQAPPQQVEEEEQEESEDEGLPRISNPSNKDLYNLLCENSKQLNDMSKQQKLVNSNLITMAHRHEFAIKTIYKRSNWKYPKMPNFSFEGELGTSHYLFDDQEEGDEQVNEDPQVASQSESEEEDSESEGEDEDDDE